MQDFDTAIRVSLPIDMDKARATSKRRQEKFRKLRGKGADRAELVNANTPSLSERPNPKPKLKTDTNTRKETALSRVLFPLGL